MTVPTAALIQIVRELTAPDGADRGLAADSVTDIATALGSTQAHALAQVLMWLAIEEQDSVALESQLNALAELSASDLLPAEVAVQVQEVPLSHLHGSSREHYEYLVSVVDIPRSATP